MSGANTKRAWKLRKLPTLSMASYLYVFVFGALICSNNNNFEFKWQVN